MNFKEAYKFPLKWDNTHVFTADDNRAFDFANPKIHDNYKLFSKKEQELIVRKINGEDVDIKHIFEYSPMYAAITQNMKIVLEMKGAPNFNGKKEQKLMDDFAAFILSQLAK